MPPLVFHQTDPTYFPNGIPVAGGLTGTPGHVTLTPVYWAPGSYAYTPNFKTIINGYVANIAADSLKATNVFAPSTQYYQHLKNQPIQHIQYVITAGTEIDDVTAYPAQNLTPGCTADTGFTACVTDIALATELLGRLTALSMPIDDAHIYMVMFPNQVETCFGPGSTGSVPAQSCSTNSYCAYHSMASVSPNHWLLYGNEPFPDLANCSGREGPQAPNGDSEADALVSTFSHEANEAITDWAGAWYDSANPGNENGDLCAFVYGQSLGGTSTLGVGGTLFNQVINSAHYYTQDEFSNQDYALSRGDVPSDRFAGAVYGCVQQEELPMAAFTVPPVIAGNAATFDGTASSDLDNTSLLTYSWNWGDGTAVSTGSSPAHIFANTGGFTIALTVTDGDLWAGSVSHMVTVAAPTVPDAPTAVIAAAGDGQVALTWTAPASDGGSPVTQYLVTPYIGPARQTPRSTSGSGASYTVTGLTNGTAYTFTAAATNSSGTGAASMASNSVTPTASSPPGPPTGVTATAGVGSATLTWTPPASGSSPISGYAVSASTGGVPIQVTGPQAVVAGLTTAAVTFTVAATSAVGTGPASTPSMSVTPLPGGTYRSLVPARVLDTRSAVGVPGRPAGPLSAGRSLDLQVTGQGGVPSTGVSTVVLNVTVTNTTASSYLSVWPQGNVQPLVSNLNWTPGKTVANLVEVAVGATGRVSFFDAAGNTDVIADVQGYVGDKTNSYSRAGMFNPLPPVRVLDTRSGVGGPAARLGPGEVRSLTVTGLDGVPATSVAAVILNVTAVDSSTAGYLTVWPAGASRPTASNMNFQAHQIVPNRVMVGVGAGGKVSIYNPAGTVDVVADVNGWFTDSSNTAGGSAFVGVQPVRIFDTRGGNNPLPGGGILTLGPPSPYATQHTALVLNVTAIKPTSSGFLSIYPNNPSDPNRTPPTASDLNFAPGDIVPNYTVVKLGPDSSFDTFNPAGTIDVAYDESGYYGASTAAPPAWATTANWTASTPVTADQPFQTAFLLARSAQGR